MGAQVLTPEEEAAYVGCVCVLARVTSNKQLGRAPEGDLIGLLFQGPQLDLQPGTDVGLQGSGFVSSS